MSVPARPVQVTELYGPIHSPTARAIQTIFDAQLGSTPTSDRLERAVVFLRSISIPYNVYAAMQIDSMLDDYARWMITNFFAPPPADQIVHDLFMIDAEASYRHRSVPPSAQASHGFAFFLSQLRQSQLAFAFADSARMNSINGGNGGAASAVSTVPFGAAKAGPFPATITTLSDPMDEDVVVPAPDGFYTPPPLSPLFPDTQQPTPPRNDNIYAIVPSGSSVGYLVTPSDEIQLAGMDAVGKQIAHGTYGAIYETTVNGKSGFVVKFGDIEQQEVTLATQMGDLGIAPLIVRSHSAPGIFVQANELPPHLNISKTDFGIYRIPGSVSLDKTIRITIMSRLDSTLLNWIHQRRPLSRLSAIRLVELLAAASESGLFHADLKPDNIGLTCHLDSRSGEYVIDRFYLIDFGMSYFRGFGNEEPPPYHPHRHLGWLRAVPLTRGILMRKFDMLTLLFYFNRITTHGQLRSDPNVKGFYEAMAEHAVVRFAIEQRVVDDPIGYIRNLNSSILMRYAGTET